jgi:hypothetical protein
MRKITKKELESLKKMHKLKCRCYFFLILGCYTWDALSKMWAIMSPILVAYNVIPLSIAVKSTPFTVSGFLADYLAKAIQLKNTKFRKKDVYQKIVRRKV